MVIRLLLLSVASDHQVRPAIVSNWGYIFSSKSCSTRRVMLNSCGRDRRAARYDRLGLATRLAACTHDNVLAGTLEVGRVAAIVVLGLAQARIVAGQRGEFLAPLHHHQAGGTWQCHVATQGQALTWFVVHLEYDIHIVGQIHDRLSLVAAGFLIILRK